MKYLSLDLEATGLRENDSIIEFAVVPFCVESKSIEESLTFHTHVKCDSFESLKPSLDPWVIEHNKELIEKAHSEGIDHEELKSSFHKYLTSKALKNYFGDSKIILFGKSMNAIDLPFLNRDLSWEFMRDHFHHQVLDLSSIVMGLIDLGQLPASCLSGSGLMKHFNLGEVSHTALEDAVNTAKLYLEIIKNTQK